MVVGKVITCVDHPNSDHLHVCMVDVGGEAPIQIVCGAPNVHAGMRVAAALDGAHLPGGVKIKKGKLRGEVFLRYALLRPRAGRARPDYIRISATRASLRYLRT